MSHAKVVQEGTDCYSSPFRGLSAILLSSDDVRLCLPQFNKQRILER